MPFTGLRVQIPPVVLNLEVRRSGYLITFAKRVGLNCALLGRRQSLPLLTCDLRTERKKHDTDHQ